VNLSHPPLRHTITTSESETAGIIASAKKLGVSVSALFHAAICLAQIKMNPIPEGAEVDFSSSSINASLERYMKPPVDPRTHFISSMTLIPLRFSMAQALMEPNEKARLIMTAKMLQERLDRYLVDPCLPLMLAAMDTMLMANLDKLESTGQQNVLEPLTTWRVTFDNLGVVENKVRMQHGKIMVENVCFGIRPRKFMSVHMWTMHSKFHFQTQCATAWGEECMKTLLEETRRIGLLVLDNIATGEA